MREAAMRIVLGSSLLTLAPQTPQAEVIQNYRYDALGRLTMACQSYPNSGERTDYAYDKAANRTGLASAQNAFMLTVNQTLRSPDGAYYLVMQTDGNLVIYGPSGAVWSTQTYGTAATRAAFQNDGNIVLYTDASAAIWDSNTAGNQCAHYALSDSGVLSITANDDRVIWTSQ